MRVHLYCPERPLPDPYSHLPVRAERRVACGAPGALRASRHLHRVTCRRCLRSLTYHCLSKMADQTTASLSIVGKVDPETGRIVPFTRADWQRVR